LIGSTKILLGLYFFIYVFNSSNDRPSLAPICTINEYVNSCDWRGIMVEPDFYYFEQLRNKYQHNKNVICLNLGIGDGRIYGCGILLPHKSIDAVSNFKED
jgi:hypothetical protein